MRDPEFIEMRNRFLIALVVSIVFALPVILFVFKTFSNNDSELLDNINNKKTVIIYLESEECSRCSSFSKVLDDNSVGYFTLNIDTDRDYETIMKKLDYSTINVSTPSLMYVENGELVSSLTNEFDKQNIYDYLSNYNLLNTK